MSKITLKLESQGDYCFEVIYPDGKNLRYYVPAGKDCSLPISAGAFVRFGLVPLDQFEDDNS